MQAHVSRSFLAKNCIFTHLSFEIETEKKFPLLLPSHNCIIITMFSFQGTWWNLLETPGGDKRDRTADLLNAIQALSRLVRLHTPLNRVKRVLQYAGKVYRKAVDHWLGNLNKL